MKMNLFVAVLSLLVTTNSFADESTAKLNCRAETILSELAGIDVGHEISFNKDRSAVASGQIQLNCIKMPPLTSKYSLVLACGGSDPDFYLFSQDGKVELEDIALYNCK